MGMFDYVNVRIPCPKCGKEVNDFQTKDSACTLTCIDADSVDNFYSRCDACGTWVEFDRPRIKRPIPTSDYTTVQELEQMGFELK